MSFRKIIILIFIFTAVVGCTDKNPLNSLKNMILDKENNNIVEKWSDVKSFVYILQDINLNDLIRTKFDLVIMDYSRDGTDNGKFTLNEISSLKNSAFGKRFVISYISIGEAEDYRYYWEMSWETNSPDWLDAENPNYPGNYKVKYWSTNWKKILLGDDLSPNTPPSDNSYIGKIISAGFDGVYLDIIDAYEYWEDKGITNAKSLMIDFVDLIAAKCRKIKPNFGIFPQNSEELITDTVYMNIITGLGREEVHYINKNISRNPSEINDIENYLNTVVRNNKLVLITDYCDRNDYVTTAYLDSLSKGYLEYCTTEELNKIVMSPGFLPDNF